MVNHFDTNFLYRTSQTARHTKCGLHRPVFIVRIIGNTFASKNNSDYVKLDIKNIVKPVIDSHPTWSEHLTPGTLQIFQDDESWNTISKKNSSKIFQKDNQPDFDSRDPSSLSSIQNSLSFSSSDEGKNNEN